MAMHATTGLADDARNVELVRARAAAEAANEAKSRYLVAVGHEMRSPLNAIYGYAQLLERGDSVSSAEAGTVIRRSTEHLTNLVEGLLEISRIESGIIKLQSDVIDVHALLQQIVEMFRVQAVAKGLTLDLRMSDRLPSRVKTDEKRLRQILINLVSNAIKYTRVGGVRVTVEYRGQVAVIEVSDTGIGIAPDDLERVFEPFERGTSPEVQAQSGIGLGLAITRVLTRIMGGDLDATSTPGAGSSFRLKLMLAATLAPVDNVPVRDRIVGYLGARRTVLVIDDDPAHSAVLQTLLRPLGFAVFCAGSGLDGIALAAQCAPDIALLDIEMPGLNGWETADRLRAAQGKTFEDDRFKIVMVSANADELRAAQSRDGAHDAFVTKPFDFDTLLAVVGGQLALRWQTATPAMPVAQQLSAPLAAEAMPFVEQLRQLASIGHIMGIESTLDDLEQVVPATSAYVAELRAIAQSYDMVALMNKLSDADRR